MKGVKQLGFRSGNWLSAAQSSEVLQRSCGDGMRAKRDYAMLARLFGCGFRRSGLAGLEVNEIQVRQGHWAVVDLIGKGGHIRTVPIPNWVKAALDQWTRAAGITEGRVFRAVARLGKVWSRFKRPGLFGERLAAGGSEGCGDGECLCGEGVSAAVEPALLLCAADGGECASGAAFGNEGATAPSQGAHCSNTGSSASCLSLTVCRK